MQMKITEKQAQDLLANRVNNKARNRSVYLSTKKRIMAEIRRAHNLGRRRISLFIENPDNPLYCVIRDKRTKEPLDDGKTPPPAVIEAAKPVAATASTPVALEKPQAPVAGAIKAVAEKKAAAPKKVPAVKKVAAKAPAAKTPVKAAMAKSKASDKDAAAKKKAADKAAADKAKAKIASDKAKAKAAADKLKAKEALAKQKAKEKAAADKAKAAAKKPAAKKAAVKAK